MTTMADDARQINFTIVPGADDGAPVIYANFCAVGHTPFDFTISFCRVMPLSETDIRGAEQSHEVKAPVQARIVLPVAVLPSLIAALQEQMRTFQESNPNVEWNKGPVH
jgi:hypothetical protein